MTSAHRIRLNTAAAMKNAISSITFRCVFCVAIYACAIALVFTLARMHSQRILLTSTLSVETLEEQEDVLRNDRFDVLASLVAPHGEVIVYDDAGACLYASTPEIAESIPYDDLLAVAPSDRENAYFEVLERSDGESGSLVYEILLCEYSESTGTSVVLDSCLCDESLHILEGSLFAETSALTQREFDLIRGEYGKDMHIERHDYKTAQGEGRTLVLASPKMSESSYRKILRESESVWPVVLVVSLVITTVAVFAMFHIIQSAMRPLEGAIRVRRRGTEYMSSGELPLELRPTYESFVELMDTLDAAHEENQTLIADVSHDLKTPLSVIGGYARAFEDGRVPKNKRMPYLHAIYEKSQAANQLLDALLTISRLNHPAFEPTLVTCDVCEQVRLAVISAQDEVEQEADFLDAEIQEDPLMVDLDKVIFARVLANLVSNACKHNKVGTRILVRCERVGDHAVVSVLDDGAGFAPDLRDSAFEPFVTENVARESGKGSGLGLTIAKKGVQLQGGRIFLSDCAPDPYVTEIVIELPLSSVDVTAGSDSNEESES